MSELPVGKGLSEKLKEWIDDYPNYYPRDFRFSFKEVIQEDIPLILQGISGVGDYHLQGFAGNDQWAEIPWVGLEEDSGLRLAYLLAKDTQVLYLAIVYQEEGAGIGSLSQKADQLREKVPSAHFSRPKNDVYLADRALVSGIVYYQSYSNPLPDDQALVSDFEAMLGLFEKIKAASDIRNPAEVPTLPAEVPQILEADKSGDQESKGEAMTQDQKTDNQALEEGRQETDDRAQAIDKPEGQSEGQGIAMEEDQLPPKIPNGVQEPGPQIDQGTGGQGDLGKGLKEVLGNIGGQVSSEKETLEEEKNHFLKMAFPQRPQKNRLIPISFKMIAGKMAKQGFYFPMDLIFNYYLSLKAKAFLILVGRLGMGKTTFPRLFAETIGATYENGRYERILVGREWADEKSLFIDSTDPFRPTPILKMFKKALINPDKPHFLLLDELDYVSTTQVYRLLIEGINGRDEPILSQDDFKGDQAGFKEYGNLIFPENLYIIATSNHCDQKNLAPDLVDCGNIIKMPDVQIKIPFPSEDSYEEENWANSRFKMKAPSQRLPEVIEALMDDLEGLQKLLSHYHCPMGYRQKNELLAYGINNGIEDLVSAQEVLDYGLSQRILPIIANQKLASQGLYRELALYCIEGRVFDHDKNRLMVLSPSDFMEVMTYYRDQDYFSLARSAKDVMALLKQI